MTTYHTHIIRLLLCCMWVGYGPSKQSNCNTDTISSLHPFVGTSCTEREHLYEIIVSSTADTINAFSKSNTIFDDKHHIKDAHKRTSPPTQNNIKNNKTSRSLFTNNNSSAMSQIIDNTNYSTLAPEYNSNTAYINFIDGTVTATGKFIPMKLKILDGPDPDNFDTKLTDIAFTVKDPSGTDQLAMIKTAILTTTSGTPLASATKSGNELIFTGMDSSSLTASDDDASGKICHLRVALDETQVIDQTKLIFTVSLATADSSLSSFSTLDAGGAETDTANNNRNRINVSATELRFTTQPSATLVGEQMFPNPVISATDIFGLIDTDLNTGAVTMTSTGTPSTQPSAVMTNGESIFTAISHTAAGTGFNITASLGSLSTTSSPFNINAVASGSYRTTGSGNWLNNEALPAIWEQFNGTDWVVSNSPSYNSSNTVFIRSGHTANSGGAWGNSIHLIINNGGTFHNNHPGTSSNLTILEGGSVVINAELSIHTTGTLEVQDSGNLIINHTYLDPVLTIWNGTEIFHPLSNVILKNWDTNTPILPNNNAISTNTFGTYDAVFGHIICDFEANLGPNKDITFLNSGVTLNLAHGNLMFRSNNFNVTNCPSDANKFIISTTGIVSSGIGGDLIIEDSFLLSNCSNTLIFKSSGTLDFTVAGHMVLHRANTILGLNSSSQTTLTIGGNLQLSGDAYFDLQSTNASGSNQTVNLYGNLTGGNNSVLSCSNNDNANVIHNNFNFVGAAIQTIDIASTQAHENQGIRFNITNGAHVELINRNFELGKNSALTVNSGGTLDFGFNNTNALNVTISGNQNGTKFTSEEGSKLIITSPEGINTSGNTGNVLTVPSNRTFNQTATFYYVGKENQITGNGLSIGSSIKNIHVILDNNNLELKLTNRTGISDGGKLEIQKGIVVAEDDGENDKDFYGPNGQLIMTGGEYRIGTITANPLSDYLPQLKKYSSYVLTGGIISLVGTGTDNTQILSGVPNYKSLSFGGSNTLANSTLGTPTYKGISSGTSVSNTIRLYDSAIVDIKNLSLGGSGTNLIMENEARLIIAGSGIKPQVTGSYSLAPNTTIEFNSNSGFEQIRLTNPIPSYANIVVSGTNVGTSALGNGANSFIQFQPNGSFTISETGLFKLQNSFGFNGFYNTAISNINTPNIILLDNSTVEYAGTNQIITPITTSSYKNVILSGSGLKQLGDPTNIHIDNNLSITGGSLNIASEEVITVNEGLLITGGTMTIEDSGSLVQINETNTNIGNISMKRNAFIKAYDYVYWSSPISNFNTNELFQNPSNHIYYWDTLANNSPYGGTGQGNWIDATNQTMLVGKGYIARGPNYSEVTLDETTFTNGTPNNGTITLNLERGNDNDGLDGDDDDDDWNLIGNPYPSSISALAFLTLNTNIDGFIKLWTHGSPPSSDIPDPFYENNNGSNYDPNDYITANATGTTSGPTGVAFNGFIASGQSFMVNTIDGTQATNLNISFTNAMRSKDYDNANFFRTSNLSVVNKIDISEEKHRIWLDLVSENNGANRLLIGYTSNATIERDRMYDAISSNKISLQNFYSIIDNKSFIIQGRGLPFDSIDRVPLGYNSVADTNYSIQINAVDGLFEHQNIYLKDNVLGYTHNLSLSPYTFASTVGTFNSRFEISFQPDSLTVIESDWSPSDVSIIELDRGRVKISVGLPYTIKTIDIFDNLGKIVYHTKGEKSTKIVDISRLSQSIYIFKIQLSDGHYVTKKMLRRL